MCQLTVSIAIWTWSLARALGYKPGMPFADRNQDVSRRRRGPPALGRKKPLPLKGQQDGRQTWRRWPLGVGHQPQPSFAMKRKVEKWVFDVTAQIWVRLGRMELVAADGVTIAASMDTQSTTIRRTALSANRRRSSQHTTLPPLAGRGVEPNH